MGLRTIEAPGVEIKEIDKSGYTPSMTGSKCFVMGYSDKGTPYEPMQFTSKAAWQLYYGDPDNEAERYFYNACAEVINQNGVLNCARIPYDNKAKDKMVGFKFKVGTTCIENPTAGDYLKNSEVKNWVDHNTNFEKGALNFVIDNKCFREVDGILSNGLEYDSEIKQYYGAVIDRFKKTYDTLNSFHRYSISYYVFDEAESRKLTKRFLTQKEAVNYLDEVKEFHQGNYWIQCDYGTKEELKEIKTQYGTSLIRYKGDWIAQPIYRKYYKEANRVIDINKDIPENVSKYCTTWGDEQWNQMSAAENVEGLKTQYKDYFENTNIASLKYIPETSASYIAISGLIYKEGSKVSTINNRLKDVKDKWQESLLSTADGMMYYNDLTDSYDLFVNAYTKDESSVANNEIPRDGYLSVRMDYLNSIETNIDFEELQAKDATLSIEVFKFKYNNRESSLPENVRYHIDGANNEFLYNKTVDEFFYDDILKLSNDADIVELYSKELWEPYRDKNLSGIIRVNNLSSAPFLSSWSHMLTMYKEEGGIKYTQLYADYMEENTQHQLTGSGYDVSPQRIKDDVPYHAIVDLDGELNNYLQITRSELPVACDLTAVDEYRTGESKVAANTFWVFDKTCATLNSIVEDKRKGDKRQMIGIFPVITTAANALLAQSLIEVGDDELTAYETISGARTKSYNLDNDGDIESTNMLSSGDIVMRFSQLERTSDDSSAIDTVSRDANGYFLPIQMNATGTGVDTENMKKIGVVVYKAYLDASEGNKVSFTPVESFVGSLDKDARNPNTGVSTFIDKIINSQSDYIYFFSNCFVNAATKKQFNEVADFFVCKLGVNGMLGWFSKETEEKIALTGLYQGMDKCFKNIEDINERDIDIVCDAGLANIAQYMKSIYGGATPQFYDLNVVDEGGNPLIKNWTCNKSSDVNAWKTVQFKYDNFCKNVRKDCMFIADGPRPLVLQGDKKIVRSSKPSNTIDANILPNVKYITGLNTNYGAGYCDWFQITDEFTGDEFWCPPSIKAMGVYINTDLNFNYWDAPAGLNRGMIQALDCAFSPTIKQAGSIYQKNWNYAINYPNDGIVLEGQKTFQVKPSAFDRVNVRRLFLRLERQTYKVARYFVYEGNTAYTRQRLIDMLNPLFYTAKVGGGIYDYKIICDESNNTPTVIDNNELRVKIGIKPVKAAEFILIDFIALATGGSFSEM